MGRPTRSGALGQARGLLTRVHQHLLDALLRCVKVYLRICAEMQRLAHSSARFSGQKGWAGAACYHAERFAARWRKPERLFRWPAQGPVRAAVFARQRGALAPPAARIEGTGPSLPTAVMPHNIPVFTHTENRGHRVARRGFWVPDYRVKLNASLDSADVRGRGKKLKVVKR